MSMRKAVRNQPKANLRVPDQRLRPVSWKWTLGLTAAVVLAFTATYAIVAAVNTVISAAYYLRILRIMVLDAPAEGAPTLKAGAGFSLYSVLLAGLVIVAGILWNPLVEAGRRAAGSEVRRHRAGRVRRAAVRQAASHVGR